MRRERRMISATKAAFGLIGGLSLLFWIQSKNIDFKVDPIEVSEYIEVQATKYGFDPNTILGLALTQSNLNPKADTKHGRGIMMISEKAWAKVTTKPWEEAFDWKENIDVSLMYLDYLRAKGLVKKEDDAGKIIQVLRN